MNEGLHRKLTLVSAPAGFGKTTLVAEWAASCGRPVAWLSLDEGDGDVARFLMGVVGALRTVASSIGNGVLAALQSPQPPPADALLAALLEDIAEIPDGFVLVLDDYHAADSSSVDGALTYLLDNLPPQMHLAIATREDPHLPIARLRANDQLTELRAADLRFSTTEAAEFLTRVMDLPLSSGDVAALEARTEGWIAGLQLAAISMRGHSDPAGFVRSFTGSNRFVLDYLVEEVLQQQSESIQAFLLRTSILDRMCGSLCDALMRGWSESDPSMQTSGQETLEFLERANLFVVPLDDARNWYRYHHLFGELLRQRLRQSVASASSGARRAVGDLHARASAWYEESRLPMEAFRHAVAAADVERAARLIESGGLPLHSLGAVKTILDWLGSLPRTALDVRPSLWAKYAELSLVAGLTTGVEEMLWAAEAGLRDSPADQKTRNLVGEIAAARATLAITRYDSETTLLQAHRALEHLDPANTAFRFTAYWTMGAGYQSLGDRAAAGRALVEALAISRASGDAFSSMLALTDLALLQECENQLYVAEENYRRALEIAGDPPLQYACEAHLGLARIYYQWNDLDNAERHGRESLRLARQYDRSIDRFVLGEVFLARLMLARGDTAGAAAALAQVDQSAHLQRFVHRLPEIAEARVLALIRQGDIAEAARLVETHDLPAGRARVRLAEGDPSAALGILEPLLRDVEEKGLEDERLRVMVLLAVARHVRGDGGEAQRLLGDALAMAEPGGFVRLFVDEGAPMQRLLQEAVSHGLRADNARRLLAAFSPAGGKAADQPSLAEPLSQRELEVLGLLAAGLTNRQIADRLYLSPHTVKVHTRNIYGKLGVGHRTQAVARARELGVLPRS